MRRYDRRAALVTGAAGGLGAAAARRLAAEGADLLLVDSNRAGVESLAAELRAAGTRAIAACVEQGSEREVRDLFKGPAREFSSLDLCFANAGFGHPRELLSLELEEWERHIRVNLTGTFLVVQEVARRMAELGHGGSIVITGSTASTDLAADLFSAYCASKAGLLMLARTAASELGSHRIRVNTVLPGLVRTAMTDAGLTHPAAEELFCADTPLGRLGLAEDVAGVVAFLGSDDAAFITGTTVTVDGGQTIRGVPRWFSTDYRVAGPPTWQPHWQTRDIVAQRPYSAARSRSVDT